MTEPTENEQPLSEGAFWRWFEPIDADDPPVVVNEDTGKEI